MSEDLSDIINNVKGMIENGNVPDNMKELLKELNSKSTNEVLTSFNTSKSKQSSDNTSSNHKNPSIDIETILKMKSIIDSLNQKDDPRANLLYSLKPYLRDSKKSKLDQYVNLLNITKVADILKKENRENNDNGLN